MTRTGMRSALGQLVTLAWIAATTAPACAQDLSQVFKAVSPSVVIVRTSEREVSADSQLARFGEVGSGVLISTDGEVMTAAHVVHLADKVVVAVVGGGRVDARIVASHAGGDVPVRTL